jgi:hypothetical protein
MHRATIAAGLVLLASLVAGCSSSTPGRLGPDGGVLANCSVLQVENECFCDTMNTGGLGPNGAACGPSTVGNGVCCADIQWPAAGLSCTCQAYQCKQVGTDGTCQCGNNTTGPTTTCSPAGASFTCCQHAHSYCECGPSVTCETQYGDVSVSQCSAGTAGNAQCLSSQQKVVPACQ